jgi:iron complex transport system permease protein
MAEYDSKIKMKISIAEKEFFPNESLRKRRMGKKGRTLAFLGVAFVLLYFICLFLPDNVTVNAWQHNLAWYIEMTKKNISVFANYISGTEVSSTRWHTTQYLIVAIVGAALSVNGAVYQGAFKNALASPSTLGVQTGGALGGTVFALAFYKPAEDITYALTEAKNMSLWDRYGSAVCILIGCFVMVFFVLITAKKMSKGGRLSTLGLILSGMVFGGAVGSVLGLIQYWMLQNNTEDARTYTLRYIMMGTFDNVYTPEHLLLIGIPLGIGITVLMLLRKRLNLLAFGEDEARTMGVNVNLTRNIIIGIATTLTGVIIAFCGVIGFIGFMVPHVTRRMVGPDFNYLVPGSALVGASVLMVIFHVGRALGLANTIGLMTSLVGGTIFLALLLYYRRRGHADWA